MQKRGQSALNQEHVIPGMKHPNARGNTPVIFNMSQLLSYAHNVFVVQVTIDRKKRSATFDFEGTGPETYGNTNAPPAVTYSAIIYSLRCMVHSDIPLNQVTPSPHLTHYLHFKLYCSTTCLANSLDPSV